MIKVVVVDDHPIVRAGLRGVLATDSEIQLLAEGADGEEAIHLVASLRPDVLVLDVNLPKLNGVQVVEQLRRAGDRTAILILTVQNDSQTIFGLLECGATGYVLKDEAIETLIPAIRSAAQGESWLSPAIATQVVQRAFGSHLAAGPASDAGIDALTPRETEVLKLLGQGLDNGAIAERLVVTRRTVQNHVSNIYGKLGLSSRMEAMLYAIRKTPD